MVLNSEILLAVQRTSVRSMVYSDVELRTHPYYLLVRSLIVYPCILNYGVPVLLHLMMLLTMSSW